LSFEASAGQSRQKSGLTHGFVAIRRLCLRRKALMADMVGGSDELRTSGRQ
jgi:hypothetical protein